MWQPLEYVHYFREEILKQGISLYVHQGVVNETKAKASLKVTPVLINSMRLLALPTPQIGSYLRDKVEQNPLMTLDDVSIDLMPVLGDSASTSESFDNDDEIMGRFVSPSLSNQEISAHGTVNWDGDNAHSAIDFLPDPFTYDSLEQYLRIQLSYCGLTEAQSEIADILMIDIDDDGYYRGSIDDVANRLGVAFDEVESVLKSIQGVSPLGIGARSLEECIALQLDEDEPLYELLRKMVAEDIESIAKNRITYLARKYKLDNDKVFEAIDIVKSLNPRPGSVFPGRDRLQYIVPDLDISSKDGALIIGVSGEDQYRLAIDEECLKLYTEAHLTDEENEYLKSKIQEANSLIDALGFRNDVLHQFGLYLVKHQHDFILHGLAYLEPMSMKDVAQEFDLSISTISRMAKDKYIRTPQGVFPIRRLFTSGSPTASPKGKVSSEAIKHAIEQLIDEEDKRAPFSDIEIAEKLHEKMALSIARRTVAKYRGALGIPGQKQRRDYGNRSS